MILAIFYLSCLSVNWGANTRIDSLRISNQDCLGQLSNSLKFSRSEKPSIINISTDRNQNNISISISDNGIGMNKEFQKQMFQPYKRFYRQDEFEGADLGLTMDKQIIDKHKGEIRCESSEGKGTEFIIVLPLTQVA